MDPELLKATGPHLFRPEALAEYRRARWEDPDLVAAPPWVHHGYAVLLPGIALAVAALLMVEVPARFQGMGVLAGTATATLVCRPGESSRSGQATELVAVFPVSLPLLHALKGAPRAVLQVGGVRLRSFRLQRLTRNTGELPIELRDRALRMRPGAVTAPGALAPETAFAIVTARLSGASHPDVSAVRGPEDQPAARQVLSATLEHRAPLLAWLRPRAPR